MYYEDTDFCIRAKNKGFKILFAPLAILWHKNAGSSSSGSPLQDYYITRNRLIFGFKYGKARTKIALLREGFKYLLNGKKAQKEGVLDFLKGKRGVK